VLFRSQWNSDCAFTSGESWRSNL